jgi:hypothetical protein
MSLRVEHQHRLGRVVAADACQLGLVGQRRHHTAQGAQHGEAPHNNRQRADQDKG